MTIQVDARVGQGADLPALETRPVEPGVVVAPHDDERHDRSDRDQRAHDDLEGFTDGEVHALQCASGPLAR